MNFRVVLITAALVATLAASATAVLLTYEKKPSESQMTAEQRLAREKFFGSSEEQPPISKGQEMRPRW